MYIKMCVCVCVLGVLGVVVNKDIFGGEKKCTRKFEMD